MSFYGKKDYWDARYNSSTTSYEWYQPYQGIRHLLSPFYLRVSQGIDPNKPHRMVSDHAAANQQQQYGNATAMPPTGYNVSGMINSGIPPREKCRVLIVGCGNSRLGEEMIRDGWKGGIIAVDWSDVVIEQMKERCKKLWPDQQDFISFHTADVTKGLSDIVADESIHLVICKGTMDALLAGPGSILDARRMMHDCNRVLCRHGSMVLVTHGNPESRLKYYEGSTFVWERVAVHCLERARYSAAGGAIPASESNPGRRALMTMMQQHQQQNEASSKHFVYISKKAVTLKPVEEFVPKQAATPDEETNSAEEANSEEAS